MQHLNFEFKATTVVLEAAEKKLLSLGPFFVGVDHQIDTYFNVAKGRLKLREGNIENALIYYERADSIEAKQSDIVLYEHQPDSALKEILLRVHGVKAIVDKIRKIYFIDNVKFHFDTVKGLGTFIEVEAIDKTGDIGIEKLKEQCSYFASFLGIRESDYIAVSYSDLILADVK
ncbi:MAG: class IV adenylate cyclase [Bacteroidetes bacterium]|nr:class IV adenylate cyclase [Bacteroidota bacterium]